jgi:thymidylate synthase (FAD)
MIPRVVILARPQFDAAHQQFLDAFSDDGTLTWRQDANATPAERLVEFAGRVCYMSFGERQSPRTNSEYIRNLIQNGHESVLEHAVWSFGIVGVSRAFSHQLVRHRIGFSFSQLSQQYHDESEANFIAPRGLDDYPQSKAAWVKAVAAARTAYKALLRDMSSAADHNFSPRPEQMRFLRTAARSVLPNATATALVMSANARSLRHLFQVRGDIIGDVEMRLFSTELFKIVQPEGPALFSGFRVQEYEDGLPILSHES